MRYPPRMTLRRILVLTGDHRLADSTKWGGGYTEDDLVFHRAMQEALESLRRWEISVCCDHAEMIARVRDEAPDMVLNLCDTGFRNNPKMELHVPALLELLDVPYTGSPPAAMVLAYDKALVNLIASSIGVPVPDERQCLPDPLIDLSGVTYPAFVKPAEGDGSVGISRTAVAHTEEALRTQLGWFARELPGRSALIQEYLSGPEYGLALIGNPGSLRALPMLEVDYSKLPPDLPPILAFESKTGPETPYEKIAIAPARLPAEAVDVLVHHASQLFERLGCRDYARFDFRTGADGTIKLLEVNPNPAWSRDAKLALMARFAGIEYPQLLEMLIDAAWTRVRPDEA